MRAARVVILVAAIALAGLTARLGVWQLDRAAAKQALQAAIDSRRDAPALAPGELARDAAAAAQQPFAAAPAELAAQAAPGTAALAGVCDVACSRLAPATVRHFGHGLVHLAPLRRTPEGEQACRDVAADLAAAGVPVDGSESLATIRWRKLVWNIAFSGLCVVSGRHTLEVMADPDLRRRLEAVMQEVIKAANADGAPLAPSVIDDFLARTAAMPSYAPSMQLDAQAGRAMELEAIYRIPLERAHRHGVTMPETTRLLRELEEVEAGIAAAR